MAFKDHGPGGCCCANNTDPSQPFGCSRCAYSIQVHANMVYGEDLSNGVWATYGDNPLSDYGIKTARPDDTSNGGDFPPPYIDSPRDVIYHVSDPGFGDLGSKFLHDIPECVSGGIGLGNGLLDYVSEEYATCWNFWRSGCDNFTYPSTNSTYSWNQSYIESTRKIWLVNFGSDYPPPQGWGKPAADDAYTEANYGKNPDGVTGKDRYPYVAYDEIENGFYSQKKLQAAAYDYPMYNWGRGLSFRNPSRPLIDYSLPLHMDGASATCRRWNNSNDNILGQKRIPRTSAKYYEQPTWRFCELTLGDRKFISAAEQDFSFMTADPLVFNFGSICIGSQYVEDHFFYPSNYNTGLVGGMYYGTSAFPGIPASIDTSGRDFPFDPVNYNTIPASRMEAFFTIRLFSYPKSDGTLVTNGNWRIEGTQFLGKGTTGGGGPGLPGGGGGGTYYPGERFEFSRNRPLGAFTGNEWGMIDEVSDLNIYWDAVSGTGSGTFFLVYGTGIGGHTQGSPTFGTWHSIGTVNLPYTIRCF